MTQSESVRHFTELVGKRNVFLPLGSNWKDENLEMPRNAKESLKIKSKLGEAELRNENKLNINAII